MTEGTIRRREARTVVRDLLVAKRISPALWSISSSGVLSLLVGSRRVEIEIKTGLSYYGLQALLRRIEGAADEMLRHRDSRQIDLEDAIKNVSAA